MAKVLRSVSRLATGKLSPIYPKQIVPAIRRVFFNGNLQMLKPRMIDGKFRIGVCVGGGPSSMALAYLLKNMPRDTLGVPIEIVALVVDTGLDPITQKQQQVRGWLNQIGVECVEPVTGRIEARRKPTDKLSPESREGLLNRVDTLLSCSYYLLGTNRDDDIDNTIRSLISIPHPSFLDLRGTFWREEMRSPSKTAYHFQAAGNPSLAFLRTQHVFIPGGRPPFSIHPVISFREEQLVETCEVFGVPYANKGRQLDPGDGSLGIIRQLREQHVLPQALSDQSLFELKTRSQMEMRDIVALGNEILKTFRIVSWDLRFGSMCFEAPQIQGAQSPIELSAYVWALGTLCSAVRRTVSKPWDFCDISVLQAIFPGIGHDIAMRSMHRSKEFVCSDVLFEMMTKKKTVDDLGTNVWRITYRPGEADRQKMTRHSVLLPFLGWMSDHQLQENEPRWALKSATGYHRHPPPTTEVKPWALAKWRQCGFLWWIRMAVRPLDALQHVRLEIWGKRHDVRVAEAVNAATETLRNRFQEAMLEAEPEHIRYNLPILMFKNKVCGFPTLDMVFIDHLAEPLEIRWLVQYKSFTELSVLLKRVKVSDHLKHEMYELNSAQPDLTGD